jgi:hypothetical protein
LFSWICSIPIFPPVFSPLHCILCISHTSIVNNLHICIHFPFISLIVFPRAPWVKPWNIVAYIMFLYFIDRPVFI